MTSILDKITEKRASQYRQRYHDAEIIERIKSVLLAKEASDVDEARVKIMRSQIRLIPNRGGEAQ